MNLDGIPVDIHIQDVLIRDAYFAAENKYFTHINGLLDESWKVAHVTHNVVEIDDSQKPAHKETFVAFVLPEKPEEDK